MAIRTKTVRVPVQWVNGHWELIYGGGVPVMEGACGELILDQSTIADPQFLNAVTRKTVIKILAEGTELRVALTIREPLPAGLAQFLLPRDATKHSHTAGISRQSRFVSIWLSGPSATQQRKGKTKGGLWLSLEGPEPRELESGVVQLPKIGSVERADSLNHAFTLLSERFEPWRQAHTGSIYQRVLYKEGERWYPLNDLRDRTVARVERTLIADLRPRIKNELGPMLA